ncbi:MAG TPA: sugar phosphate isomerase/epimerase, partial [Clostridia bacterium]|nr:sugar phosphate isomerase/epimerase [Clostridia bacterium]
MSTLSRREFLGKTAAVSLGTAALLGSNLELPAADPKPRKMTIDLVCGAIGVSANQREAIELAAKHGFESVGVDAGYMASLSDDQLAELKASMKA